MRPQYIWFNNRYDYYCQWYREHAVKHSGRKWRSRVGHKKSNVISTESHWTKNIGKYLIILFIKVWCGVSCYVDTTDCATDGYKLSYISRLCSHATIYANQPISLILVTIRYNRTWRAPIVIFYLLFAPVLWRRIMTRIICKFKRNYLPNHSVQTGMTWWVDN